MELCYLLNNKHDTNKCIFGYTYIFLVSCIVWYNSGEKNPEKMTQKLMKMINIVLCGKKKEGLMIGLRFLWFYLIIKFDFSTTKMLHIFK